MGTERPNTIRLKAVSSRCPTPAQLLAEVVASLAEAAAQLEVLRAQVVDQASQPAEPADPQGMHPRLLTVRQAAAALGVGQSTVHNLIRSGELGSRKIGGSRRVPVEELDAFIAGLPGQQVGA